MNPNLADALPGKIQGSHGPSEPPGKAFDAPIIMCHSATKRVQTP